MTLDKPSLLAEASAVDAPVADTLDRPALLAAASALEAPVAEALAEPEAVPSASTVEPPVDPVADAVATPALDATASAVLVLVAEALPVAVDDADASAVLSPVAPAVAIPATAPTPAAIGAAIPVTDAEAEPAAVASAVLSAVAEHAAIPEEDPSLSAVDSPVPVADAEPLEDPTPEDEAAAISTQTMPWLMLARVALMVEAVSPVSIVATSRPVVGEVCPMSATSNHSPAPGLETPAGFAVFAIAHSPPLVVRKALSIVIDGLEPVVESLILNWRIGVTVSNPVHSPKTIMHPVAASPVQSKTGVHDPGDAPAVPTKR